jgi:hypothetical protein
MPDLFTGCAQLLKPPCEVTRRQLLALSPCGIPSIYPGYRGPEGDERSAHCSLLSGDLSTGCSFGTSSRSELGVAAESRQVYTTLQRLERDGWSRWTKPGRRAKSFRLTGAGAAELHSWLHLPDLSSPPRDELVIKVLVATRVPVSTCT